MAAACVFVLVTSPRGFAQDIDTIRTPLAELSAGHMFMREVNLSDDLSEVDHVNFPVGWYFSGAVNPTDWFGLVGEVSGSHKNDFKLTVFDVNTSSDAQVYTYMGGGRFFHRFGRLVPYAQVLAGVAHMRMKVTVLDMPGSITESATEFAIQPGGGIGVYVTDNLGLRLGADYRSIIDFVKNEKNDYSHEFRVISGFTLQWGR
jgi:opacity protein-like surface antigen